MLMNEYKVHDHEPSWLPEGNWEMVWHDEFDGTELDRTKWDYRLHMMQRRWPAWTDKGVHLDGNSNCVFTILEEDGKIVSSQLQTGYNYMDQPVTQTQSDTTIGKENLQWPLGKLKQSMYLHGHGYYECRCRLQQMEGWWSAFWIQSPVIGASLNAADTGAEIDIMESFHPGKIAGHNVFSGGYGLNSKRIQVPGKIAKELDEKQWHRFGVLWDENGYIFYIDGEESGRITEEISHRPQFILLSTEVRGYRSIKCNGTFTEDGVKAAKAGDTFLVDYVRVFEKR